MIAADDGVVLNIMVPKRIIVWIIAAAGLCIVLLTYINKIYTKGKQYNAVTMNSLEMTKIFLETDNKLQYPTKLPPVKEDVQRLDILKSTDNNQNVDILISTDNNQNGVNLKETSIETQSRTNKIPKLLDHVKIDKNQSKNYGVLAVTTATQNTLERYHYVFLVPLAILAWKRIGFETIVLIAGKEEDWLIDSRLKLILTYIQEMHSLYIFLDISEHQKVMMSQVSRIFAGSLLSDVLNEDDYLITSDVDLWPLEAPHYHLKLDRDILVLNSECCGSFVFKDQFYRMVPLGNFGARVKTWKQLITSGNQTLLPKTAEDVIVYLKNEFGDLVDKRVVKGENEGWYMDQRLLSMLVSSWIKQHDIRRIDFVRRDVGNDRVDRSWWSTKSFEGKIDIHTLDNIFQTGIWLKMLPLFRELYGDNQYSSLYSVCLLYFDDFRKELEKINQFH